MRRLFAFLAFAIALTAISPAAASAQASDTRTVIAVDVSGSMGQGGRVEQARAGAKDLVGKRIPGEQMALVTFGEKTRVVVPFTTDDAALHRAIDAMVLDGSTALWDAIRLATEILGAQPSTQHRLVVFSDGDDTVSATTYDEARAAVANTRTVVSVIALPGSAPESGRLGGLVRESGGQFTTRASVDGGARGVPAKKIWNPLGGSGKWVAIGASLFAALLLVTGLILLFMRRESMVEQALAPYSGSQAATEKDDHSSAFVQSAFLKRAVALTGRFAARRGVLSRVDGDLERADLPIRAAELLFFAVTAIVLIGVVALALAKSLFVALFVVILASLAPVVAVKIIGKRKRQKFVSQLPDMLNLVAGALRAGFSFLQALETVSSQIDGPMGKELRRIIAETRLGRGIEDSMEETARRMSSDDFDWVVMAVRIQREVGGNLSEVLDSVAETMIVRDRLRREIKALTAEGRISMVILSVMPVGLGLFLYLANRPYISVLFTDPTGRLMAGGAAILASAGVYWMRKTTEIEL